MAKQTRKSNRSSDLGAVFRAAIQYPRINRSPQGPPEAMTVWQWQCYNTKHCQKPCLECSTWYTHDIHYYDNPPDYKNGTVLGAVKAGLPALGSGVPNSPKRAEPVWKQLEMALE